VLKQVLIDAETDEARGNALKPGHGRDQPNHQRNAQRPVEQRWMTRRPLAGIMDIA